MKETVPAQFRGQARAFMDRRVAQSQPLIVAVNDLDPKLSKPLDRLRNLRPEGMQDVERKPRELSAIYRFLFDTLQRAKAFQISETTVQDLAKAPTS